MVSSDGPEPPEALRERPMTKTRDWGHYRDMWVRILKKQTGKDLAHVWGEEVYSASRPSP